MTYIEKVTSHIVKYISRNTNYSHQDIEKINYGIQVILINLGKILLLLLTAYFLGIFSEVLVALAAFALVRAFAAGVHASSSFICIIVNYIVFLGNVYFCTYFNLNRVIMACIFVATIVLLYFYAPADTYERPIISSKLRKSSKIKSIIVVAALTAVSFSIYPSIFGEIISISILEETFFTTPLAYKIFGKSYKNYENFHLKG